MPVKNIPEYLSDAEVQENTVRKDFKPSEAADIYDYYLPQVKASVVNGELYLERMGQSNDIS